MFSYITSYTLLFVYCPFFKKKDLLLQKKEKSSYLFQFYFLVHLIYFVLQKKKKKYFCSVKYIEKKMKPHYEVYILHLLVNDHKEERKN